MQGLIGKKIGMTQVYDAEGRLVPVTALQAGPCVVVQKKTREKDGYEAVQLGFLDKKEVRSTKAMIAHCKKANTAPKYHLGEFAAGGTDAEPGQVVNADIFEGVGYVDVSGVSKGRGFQGVVKRYRMSGGPMTHGGHSKRRIGSIGMREKPGKIHKGHRMPGQMGNVNVTQQNLRVVEVRAGENLILVEGAVPGANGAMVVIRKALKKAAAGK